MQDFEDAFSNWIGTPYVQATSNATGALVTALLALDIGPGDEVVMPSYAWVGSAGAVRLIGATPVWADIDPATFQVDPQSVETAVTSRTQAILAVHLCGHPCRIGELASIARAADVHLIEDAAQAMGAAVDGRRTGLWGDFGVFSLGPGKLLEAGEGGVLVARSEELHEAALLVAQHPLRQEIEVKNPQLRHQIGSLRTLNFRIHPLACVMALAGLPELDGRIADLRTSYARLRDELRDWDAVRVALLLPSDEPTGASLPIHIEGDDPLATARKLAQWLRARGHSLKRGPIGMPCHLRGGPAGSPAAGSSRVPLSETRCSGREFFIQVGVGGVA